MLSLNDQSITIINTSNWFQTDYYLDQVNNELNHFIDDSNHIVNASYVARASVRTPQEMNDMVIYLKTALQKQINGESFAIVEMVFPCFYRLASRPQYLMDKGTIQEINTWFNQNITGQFRLGVINE